MKKYYEILEVNQRASKEIIEKAYRVLVKKYHPDLYSGEKRLYAEQKIKDINEAYKILSDEFLREQYDLELEKEIQYGIEYQSLRKTRKENRVANKKNTIQKEEKKDTIRMETHGVGTFMGIVDVAKALFQNRPNVKNAKDIKREDLIAAGLTLLIMIILGVVLWFIPATNGFIRSIIPFV